MKCALLRQQFHPYMDGELDAPTVAKVDNHLRACAACSRVYRDGIDMRRAIKRHATYYTAGARLREQIEGSVRLTKRPAQPSAANWLLFPAGWVGAASAAARFVLDTSRRSVSAPVFACTVMLLGAATFYRVAPNEQDHLPQEIVSSHVRSLISTRTTDIASADEVTLKPWFDGKLDFSPPVTDLHAKGFTLVGGRLDYLKDRRVAALVYTRDGHVINLYAWPVGAHDAATQTLSRHGYNLVNWTQSGMFFCAVSDISKAELAHLAAFIQAGRG